MAGHVLHLLLYRQARVATITSLTLAGGRRRRCYVAKHPRRTWKINKQAKKVDNLCSAISNTIRLKRASRQTVMLLRSKISKISNVLTLRFKIMREKVDTTDQSSWRQTAARCFTGTRSKSTSLHLR